VFSERFLWHHPGVAYCGHEVARALDEKKEYIEPDQHFENKETKRRVHALLAVSGLLDVMTPVRARPASAAELQMFHSERYVRHVKALSDELGGETGEFAPCGKGSFEIAALAVGACIAAVDAVMKGEVNNCYVLCRPPGHHAERDRGMGFCIFSNVALAAKHAQKAYGLQRMAIVDWDVHHGNGTQQAFYDDPSVLYISLHQNGLYPPNSGLINDSGSGAGVGYTINIPFPPGSGEGAYELAFDTVVLPALRVYRPELLLVSSGFDAGALDPLSHIMLSSEAFAKMTRAMMAVAAQCCSHRLVMVHEGGYSAASVPFLAARTVDTLCGTPLGIVDPFRCARFSLTLC